MECPACTGTLQEIETGGLRVDVCRDGCLGTWFDPWELDKVDESHEAAGQALLDRQPGPEQEPDKSARRACPRDGAVMMRHFFSALRQVEVDCCPACNGVWLDAGELARIRQSSRAEEDAAAGEVFDRGFGEAMAAMRRESEATREHARGIANALRWICPSYWIPGKQNGAAF